MEKEIKERFEEIKKAQAEKFEKELADKINSEYGKILKEFGFTTEDIEEKSKEYSDEDINKLYEKSIQDENNTKRQEIKGETYKSKLLNILIKIIIAAATFTVIAVALKFKSNSDKDNLVFQYKIIREHEAEKMKLLNVEKDELTELTRDDADRIKASIKTYREEHKDEYEPNGRHKENIKSEYADTFPPEIFIYTSTADLNALKELAHEEVQAKYHERPVIMTNEPREMPRREIVLKSNPGYPIEEVKEEPGVTKK